MKKILTLTLLILSIFASAQTEKGSFMIGGNGSISFQNSHIDDNSSKSRSFSIELNPLAGYFVANNFSVGLSLPLSLTNGKSTYAQFYPEYKSSSKGIGLSPFVRYYIPVKSFFIVTEGAYSWTYSKFNYDTVDPDTGEIIGENEFSSKNNSIRLAVGPTFFLSRYSSIEILANYEHNSVDDPSSLQYKTSNFYISVGFQLYLPKVKE